MTTTNNDGSITKIQQIHNLACRIVVARRISDLNVRNKPKPIINDTPCEQTIQIPTQSSVIDSPHPELQPLETNRQLERTSFPPKPTNIQSPSPSPLVIPDTDYRVYKLGDAYYGSRITMPHLGLDIGTKTVVLAYRNEKNKVDFISEINGYWIFERPSVFIEKMLNDNRERPDGTKRPAKWIKLPETDQICVLGQDAEEFAYATNNTLLRPMAEGGIAPDQEAMTVLASIVQGLMEMAEKEIGKFEDDVKICYCTTAPAINKESNIPYHERVVNLIIGGYETNSKIYANNIKESHAIVLNESPDGTGIGISWGAGTVTVSYIKYGIEIYSFCWVGAGDWIDEQVAMRHGYNPEALKTRRKMAKETPTTVCKRKHDIDLTPGNNPEDRVGLDIVLHYDVLIHQVVDGIVRGFLEHEAEARIEDAITVYMAGGTSSPKGFEERVGKIFDESAPPFAIASIKKSSRPLYSVAEGCLKAAEAS